MNSIIEIERNLVPALRLSPALPGTQEHGKGDLHILFNPEQRPIGYMVCKTNTEDAWETLEPRYFITTSYTEAMKLLAAPVNEIPAREPLHA